MLKFLTNIFNQYKKPSIKPSNNSQTICSLVVEVNTDGSINILCDWPEFNVNNAKSIRNISYYYATAIHALNNGLLESDIIGTLNNYDKSNEFNGLFVHNTLVELINIEKQIRKNNTDFTKPVVSPLNVFRTS